MQEAEPLAVRASKLDLIERLADDLAHEIKNPLHSMVINLEVLKRRITRHCDSGEDSEEMMRYVRVLVGELERVNRRVDLLLRLSRPGRGTELTTLDEVVGELLELIELEATHRGTSVRYDPSPQMTRVCAARDAVRQVVLNLVLDALDGAARDDTLVLHADCVNDRARLRVECLPSTAASPETDGGPSARTGEYQPVSRLSAARALSEAAGGRVEVLHDGSGPASGPAPGRVSLLFSLPLAPA